jgi:hypothetical protein
MVPPWMWPIVLMASRYSRVSVETHDPMAVLIADSSRLIHSRTPAPGVSGMATTNILHGSMRDGIVPARSWCVKHMLDELRCYAQSFVDDLPRVWWIGSGFASSSPFHSARDMSAGPMSSACYRAVSPYTPTFKALQYALCQTFGVSSSLNSWSHNFSHTHDGIQCPTACALRSTKLNIPLMPAGALRK